VLALPFCSLKSENTTQHKIDYCPPTQSLQKDPPSTQASAPQAEVGPSESLESNVKKAVRQGQWKAALLAHAIFSCVNWLVF